MVSSLGNSTAQKFGYNDKEENNELGLALIDLGARFMDPAIGRFTTIDPLADFANYQSPYAMAENNPVLNVDIEGLGIFNVIGNLWRRLKNAVKNCSRVCKQPSGEDSLGDSWRKPDFKKKKRSRKTKRGNKKSSKTRQGTTQSKNPVKAINVTSNPEIVNNSTINFGNLDISIPSVPVPPSPELVNGISIVPGQVTSAPANLQYGTLDLGLTGNVVQSNVNLGNDLGTQRSLQQIANVLLMNPNIRMRIDFANPNFIQTNGRGRVLNNQDLTRIRQWNRAKFQTLARFLNSNFGINPNRLSFGQVRFGGRLTFF